MFTVCQVCGKEFESEPARRRKFCSRACVRIARTTRVQRTCAWCGKEFSARPYEVKKGGARFCSRACVKNGRIKSCQNCGKPVYCYSSQRRYKHCFCSLGCYHHWNRKRITQACQQCGREFQVNPSNIALGRGKYCSVVCQGLARRVPDAARSEYNHEFTKALKEQIRQRDNYTCRLCGIPQTDTRRALACHHIDYDKANNHPKNLITLCASCHIKTNSNREHWRMVFSATIR